jgi:hypothetical protein
MLDALRDRIADLSQTLVVLKQLLGRNNAEELPPMLMCRTAVALDNAACEIARWTQLLEHAGKDKPQRRGRSGDELGGKSQ